LLLALNDCKKYNYQGKYHDNEFLKYVDCYKSIGIQLDIEKTAWMFFDINKECPQTIEKDTSNPLFAPTKEYGVFAPKNHPFDIWAWSLLADEKKAYLKKMLGRG